MVKVKSFTLYLILFIFALMYFFPKISMYYFLEKELKRYDFIISDEELVDCGYTLRINGARLSVKSVEVANISQSDVKIYGVYNSVRLQDIVLSSAASAFVPLNINNADISYTIFNPLNIKAHAVGEFGSADAKINIADRAVEIKLIPSKKMLDEYKSTLANLKKSENGEYVYDKNF